MIGPICALEWSNKVSFSMGMRTNPQAGGMGKRKLTAMLVLLTSQLALR